MRRFGNWRNRFQFAVLGLLFAGFSPPSPTLLSCDDCSGLPGQIHKLTNSIKRLRGILKINKEFLDTLLPSDDSERIKVNSNLSIAKKRILAVEQQTEIAQEKLQSDDCKKCLNK